MTNKELVDEVARLRDMVLTGPLKEEFLAIQRELTYFREYKLLLEEPALQAEVMLLTQKYELLREWYLNTLDHYDGLINRKDMQVRLEKDLNIALQLKVLEEI